MGTKIVCPRKPERGSCDPFPKEQPMEVPKEAPIEVDFPGQPEEAPEIFQPKKEPAKVG